MLVSDILNSCADEHVAEAAVASIGGLFAHQIRTTAEAQGRTIGGFTAERVRLFSRFATERDWRTLARRMQGEDLPLLTGLESVMERMMADAHVAPG